MRLMLLFILCMAVLVFAEEPKPIHLPIGPNSQASSANTYQDFGAGFSAIIPDGWRRENTHGTNMSLIIDAPLTAINMGAGCNVRVIHDERLLQTSNDALLAKLDTAYAEALVASLSTGNTNTITSLSRFGTIPISGVRAIFVEYTATFDQLKARAFLTSFINADAMFSITCISPQETYAYSLPEFGVFINSLKLLK